jgi:hypothetical protein
MSTQTQSKLVGKRVQFWDRYRTLQTGTITSTELFEGKWCASVHTDDQGNYLMPLTKLRDADSEQSKAVAEAPEHFVTGQVVKVSLGGSKPVAGLTEGCYAVVTADKGSRVNIVVLGGHSGQYGRFPRNLLTPVEGTFTEVQS